jgi:hypothetical protein
LDCYDIFTYVLSCRHYYRCTQTGCLVRKHIERSSHDPTSVITTYEGKHIHILPASRNASHEMSTAPMNTAMHPINSNMPGLGGMMRACEERTLTNQYSQAANTISLDLGVGISPNHSDTTNNMQNSVPEPMQYQVQSMAPVYSSMGLPGMPVQAVHGNAANTFIAAPLDRSSNLYYGSAGNLMMGP